MKWISFLLFHITGQSVFQRCLKTTKDRAKRRESFINVLMLKQPRANTCGLSRDAAGLASVGVPCPQSNVTHDVITSRQGTKEEVAMFRFPAGRR